MAKVNIGTVWDRASEFLGDELAAIGPVVVSFIFVPQAIIGIMQPLAQGASQMAIIGLQIVTLLLTLVAMWGQFQITALAIAPAEGVAAARNRASAGLLPLFALNLLLLAVALLLLAPVPVALVATGTDPVALMRAAMQNPPGQMPAIAPAAALFVSLYSIVYALFWLWVTARLMPMSAVVLAERLGIGAFARSFALTRGLSLALVGVLVLYAVVTAVATLAARALFGSLLALVLGAGGGFSVAGIVGALAVAGVTAALYALAAAFGGKLYLACRAREADGA